MKKGQALYDEMKRASNARKKKSNTTTTKTKSKNTTSTTTKKKPSVRFGVGSNKIIKKDGKQFANVTADQLKRTGLSQAAYMKMWNKTGKRPTKASVNAAKTKPKTTSRSLINRTRKEFSSGGNMFSDSPAAKLYSRMKKAGGNRNPRGRAGRN
tara:strand:+ start:4092 stop:4553 length:462 start_codon:yes stop_codon:yes gene_type:complete